MGSTTLTYVSVKQEFFVLGNPLVAADQERMIWGPFVMKLFIGILAFSYATSGLPVPFSLIALVIIGIAVAKPIFHFARATLCPCSPV